jgi:hypothetical protein
MISFTKQPTSFLSLPRELRQPILLSTITPPTSSPPTEAHVRSQISLYQIRALIWLKRFCAVSNNTEYLEDITYVLRQWSRQMAWWVIWMYRVAIKEEEERRNHPWIEYHINDPAYATRMAGINGERERRLQIQKTNFEQVRRQLKAARVQEIAQAQANFRRKEMLQTQARGLEQETRQLEADEVLEMVQAQVDPRREEVIQTQAMDVDRIVLWLKRAWSRVSKASREIHIGYLFITGSKPIFREK